MLFFQVMVPDTFLEQQPLEVQEPPIQLRTRTNLIIVHYGETMSAHRQAMYKFAEVMNGYLQFNSRHIKLMAPSTKRISKNVMNRPHSSKRCSKGAKSRKANSFKDS
jgi:hypothetical protein